ncbi:MAG: DNA gyrase C-terminal beta-propeller domain-containing protein, partial [archaeon]|nr:DNA gyrase C-terminal beta-propeller domain-containing protein [archaeon]
MQVKDPETPVEQLMKVMPGPDFPTGGIMYGRIGILSAYRMGRGKIKLRAKTEIEDEGTDSKEKIIITELPYQVNKANLIKKIADLVSEKTMEGIRDIRDESDREGMRVVIELSKGANNQILLNQLFRHTDMEITYGIINLALVNNEPKILALNQIIAHFIDHRIKVITRRTEFDLKKAQDRAHILEGLKIALSNIDDIVALIKSSDSKDDARKKLIASYSLTEIQADAILQMRLSTLTGLEREKIDREYEELMKVIAELREILASHQMVLDIIISELEDIKERYGRERMTEIANGGDIETIEDEDLIPREDMIVTITEAGYIKRVSQEEYRTQRRGGKGVIGMTTKDEDSVVDIFSANTHDYLLFFSNKGQVRWRKVYSLPLGGRYSKGRPIVNVLNLKEDEEIRSILPSKDFDDKHYIIMVSRNGVTKKTIASAFANPRHGGIRALTLRDGDDLVSVNLTDGEKDIFIASHKGKAIHFNESEIRPMGRTAAGVRGIRLDADDYVIGMTASDSEGCILTISRNGYGKRTPVKEYRETKRGGKGVRNLLVTEKTGNVIAIKSVTSADEIMLTSANGKLIRTSISEIRVIGRSTQGVRLMRIEPDDRVMAVSLIKEKDDDEEDNAENNPKDQSEDYVNDSKEDSQDEQQPASTDSEEQQKQE